MDRQPGMGKGHGAGNRVAKSPESRSGPAPGAWRRVDEAGVTPPAPTCWTTCGSRWPTRALPRRIRYWSRFDLVIIDEFGFDRIERGECPQAANLFYKVIDARSGKRSTALATNIDFEAWSEYLGDPPLAMAFLDRVVDGAILLKIRGKSYRAHRAKKRRTRRSRRHVTPRRSRPSCRASTIASFGS